MDCLTVEVVVPCFNEEGRLDVEAYVACVEARSWLEFLFVDDGSTDTTARLIADAARRSPRIRALSLERNAGKGEAVRRGVLDSLGRGAHIVGFWDADLATPLETIDTLRSRFQASPSLEIAMASRVNLLGMRIVRSAARHYIGRVAATAISLILGVAVYDTQCGAKLFRAVPRIRRVFDEPFIARWMFDVEILARWLEQARVPATEVGKRVIEVPVSQWNDIGGSKLRFIDLLLAPADLVRIQRKYPRRVGRSIGSS